MRMDWLSIPQVYALVNEDGHVIVADPCGEALKEKVSVQLTARGLLESACYVMSLDIPEKELTTSMGAAKMRAQQKMEVCSE